jgi:hypothetical protein
VLKVPVADPGPEGARPRLAANKVVTGGFAEITVRRVVRFDAGFLEPPTVLVGVSLWDCDSSANLRADIAADAVTTEGFEIVFRTWADSRIARIRVGWTAMGPLPHEDDWPL